MAKYSYSKLETFRKCPLQYRFIYIDGLRKEEEGIEAFTGNCVHAALEELMKLKRDFDREPDRRTAEELFLKEWDARFHPGVVIRRENVTAEDYKKRGLMCIRNFFEMEGGRDCGELVDLERRFDFPLGDATIGGVIDRLHRDGTTFHIIDYKTSTSDMSQEQADADTQLALYEIGVRELYPDAGEVVLHWYMLPHKNVVSSRRSSDDLERVKAGTVALIDKIEAATDFPPCESTLCGWCDFHEECEKERRRHTIAAAEVEPPLEDVVEEYVALDAERRRLKDEVKAREARMEEIESRLAEVAKETGAWSIQGRDNILDIEVASGLYMPGKGSAEREALMELISRSGLLEEVSEISKPLIQSALSSGRFGDLAAEIAARFEERETIRVKIRKAGG